MSELERWTKVLDLAPEMALTEAIKVEMKSAFGIHIPESVKAPKSSFFRVLKMGPGFAEHANVKGTEIGDIVVPREGYPFTIDGKLVQVVKAENCIGKVTKAAWEASHQK
jgi:co-chaperonin GroES (HSP10)